MADLGLDLSRNLSYFADLTSQIPAAFVLCILPNVYAVSLAPGAYDVGNPRRFVATVKADTRLEKMTQQRIGRAKAASDNGFETLGFFAAAVVAANHAAVPARAVNLLAGGYLVSRVGYILAYVHLGADRGTAPVRSLCWLAGIAVAMTLYIKAALALL